MMKDDFDFLLLIFYLYESTIKLKIMISFEINIFIFHSIWNLKDHLLLFTKKKLLNEEYKYNKNIGDWVPNVKTHMNVENQSKNEKIK